ncbi:MAG: hypothetical protein LBC33_03120 [Mycoplasmataceae bacterium]|nr:hypothetical protein [Mycoplasmataceae bacterium]
MRKLTVKVMNSTQVNRIGVNETLAVVKRETVRHGGGSTRKPKRKSRSSQSPKWFVEFATRQEQFNQMIIERLDNLDRRLDNLIKKNKLLE